MRTAELRNERVGDTRPVQLPAGHVNRSHRRKLSISLAVLLVAVAQGLLTAVGIGIGADPAVAAAAATSFALCGIVMVVAAGLQS